MAICLLEIPTEPLLDGKMVRIIQAFASPMFTKVRIVINMQFDSRSSMSVAISSNRTYNHTHMTQRYYVRYEFQNNMDFRRGTI